MMRKFRYLIGYSIGKRIYKKGFVISQLIMLVLIVGLINLGSIIKFFGGGSDSSVVRVVVFDQTEHNVFTYFDVKEDDKEQPIQYFQATEVFSEEKKDELFKDADVLVILEEKEKDLVASYHYRSLEIMQKMTIDYKLSEVRSKYLMNSFSEETRKEIELISKQMQIQVFSNGEEEKETQRMIMSSLSIFFMMPVFILIIYVTQMISMEIIEEKATRSIEVIISNVTPMVHFSSKSLSAILWVVMQMGLMLLYGLIGTVLSILLTGSAPMSSIQSSISNSGMPVAEAEAILNLVNRIPSTLAIVVIFGLLGFVMYIILAAVFSAMATSAEDYQQFQAPMMLSLVAGLYIGIFGSMLPGAESFLKVCGYIPLFSPMLAPMLFANGTLGVIDIIISGIILVVFVGGIIYFAIPIYKTAILSYSQDKFFARIKKIIKNAKYTD